MKSRSAIIAGLLTCASCSLEAPPEPVDRIARPLWGGQVYDEGCSPADKLKLHDAVAVLLAVGSTQFAAYSNCLLRAEMVEVPGGESVDKIASYIKTGAVTTIRCRDLDDGVNAMAHPLWFGGEDLTIDTGFVAGESPLRIASVIGHELMHNRGFHHSENPFGTRHHPNTVPEQVEACILNGNPNPMERGWSDPPPPPVGIVCRSPKVCCEPLADGTCGGPCISRNQSCP